jgi:hypothetical protein
MGAEGQDRLVRIDATGTAHPVGRAASRELRRRQAEMVLLPAPSHVAAMRHGQVSVPWMIGEIARPGALWDLIGMIGQGSWTGELVVTDADGSERSIFFEGGSVIGANSTADRERLGEVLYHYGVLTEDQIAMVLDACTPEVRFGEAAVALGFLGREKLFEMIGKQTEEIVYGVMMVERGSFFFVEEIDTRRLPNRMSFTVASLMMEGVRRMDEMSCFRARIPSSLHVPSRSRDATVSPGHEHYLVFQAIDGHRSIDDIGRTLGLGQFDTTRAVFQLLQAAQITVSAPKPTGPEAIVSLFNQAMELILSKVDEVQGGQDVREQLASFATASGVHDALFRGAGPRPNGTLDAGRIADNIEMLVGKNDATKMLTQWLYEYATFAMFIAEPLLRSRKSAGYAETEGAQVSRRVAELLRPLAPE